MLFMFLKEYFPEIYVQANTRPKLGVHGAPPTAGVPHAAGGHRLRGVGAGQGAAGRDRPQGVPGELQAGRAQRLDVLLRR